MTLHSVRLTLITNFVKNCKRRQRKKAVNICLICLRNLIKESAERLHPNNVRRIIRAIEFYKTTGKPISKHQEETKRVESRYNSAYDLY